MVHAYTGWIAWRFWVQHENLSLGSGSCTDPVLLVIMLVAIHSYSAFLVLRITGLWAPLVDTLVRVGNVIGDVMNRYAFIKPVLWTACFAALLARSALNSTAAMEGVICAAGQLVLVAGCCVYSRHPRSIRWAIPLSALFAHHLMALLFIHIGAGYEFLSCVEHLITRLMSFSQHGAAGVLGYLSTGQMAGWAVPAPISFAFVVLPGVLFLGALAILLLHYGVVSPVIAKTGWLVHNLFGITSCEAIVALANAFFGMAEAPLLVLPYLARMTRSELHCVMTVGFATISAALLPTLTHLDLSLVDVTISSILSTLAAIASSKLLYPETEHSVTAHYNLHDYESPGETYVEALESGTVILVAIVPAIAYTLVAFLSAAAFVNDVCAELGRLGILTALLKPMALLMGIGLDEMHMAARVLASALFLSEIDAYRELTSYVARVAFSSHHNQRITPSTTDVPASVSAPRRAIQLKLPMNDYKVIIRPRSRLRVEA
ncbi:sodium/nucleoside cotransporter 2-like [Haemaphysalis longicornis]